MTRNDLEKSFFLRGELSSQREELQRLKSASLVQSPRFGGIRSTVRIDKVAARANNIVDLEASIKQTSALLDEVHGFIQNIPDPLLRSILENKWWNNFTWEQTSKLLGASSPVSIRKRYSRFAKNAFLSCSLQVF